MNRFLHPIIPAQSLGRLARVMERWIEECAAVEVPLDWMAQEPFVEATRPPNVPPQPQTPYGHLVASGEQTFLQLAEEGQLPFPGRYIGWTPCFRQETFDAQHHFYFLKAEVFAWLDETRDEQPQLLTILELARQVLQDETSEMVQPVSLEDGTWDLEVNGVEVGSYGIRRLPLSGRRYVYGTALAEPRFSFALRQGRNP
jgi:Seryl-tRNA synthetase